MVIEGRVLRGGWCFMMEVVLYWVLSGRKQYLKEIDSGKLCAGNNSIRVVGVKILA